MSSRSQTLHTSVDKNNLVVTTFSYLYFFLLLLFFCSICACYIINSSRNLLRMRNSPHPVYSRPAPLLPLCESAYKYYVN